MAKILLVDDEEIVLKSVGALLEGEGHTVTGRQSVPEALEAMESTVFDLLITDIRMAPVDGMELIRIVHQKTPGFPIIVISAYTSDKIMEKGYKMGCRAYLPKPFRIEDVLSAVDEALSGK